MDRDRSIVRFRGGAEYAYRSALQNLREGRTSDALELLRQATAAEPENETYLMALARLYRDIGNTDRCERLLLDRLARPDVTDVDGLYYELAIASMHRNDPDMARALIDCRRTAETDIPYERSLSDPEFSALYTTYQTRRQERSQRLTERAGARLFNGAPECAIRLCERAISTGAADSDTYAIYFVALVRAGRPDDAMKAASVAIAMDGRSARAMGVVASTLQVAGYTDRARELLETQLEGELEPKELHALGMAAAGIGMYELTEECARRALHSEPCSIPLLKLQVVARSHTDAPNAEAESALSRILRLEPDDIEAGYWREHLSLRVPGRDFLPYGCALPEAEAARLDELLRSDPEHAWSTEDGRRAVRRAVQLHRPEGLLALASSDDPEAISLLRLALYRDEPDALTHMALLARAATHGIEPAVLEPLSHVHLACRRHTNGRPVGEKQLLLYADECLQDHYGMRSMALLCYLWSLYRSGQPSRGDVLTDSEAASAALALHCLALTGHSPELHTVADEFKATPRRLIYYTQRIRHVLSAIAPDIDPDRRKETQ